MAVEVEEEKVKKEVEEDDEKKVEVEKVEAG